MTDLAFDQLWDAKVKQWGSKDPVEQPAHEITHVERGAGEKPQVEPSAREAYDKSAKQALPKAPDTAEKHLPSGGFLLPDNTVAKDRIGPGNHRFNTTVQGQTREYEVHLPRGYDGSKPVPAFYVMPGIGETIQDMKSDTQLNAIADKKGFAVVYLQAQVKTFGLPSWSLNHGSLSEKAASYDDLKYVKNVQRQVGNLADIDSSKQYIVGHSEGGDAAQYIAHSMPGVFAGIAGVKSTRQGADPLPRKDDPMAAIFVLGENDPILPIRGGADLPILGLAVPNIFGSRPLDQAKEFARANQCSPGTTRDDGYNRTTQYSCKLAPVKEIVHHGGGHHWNDQYTRTKTSNQIVDFLLKYQKPEQKQ